MVRVLFRMYIQFYIPTCHEWSSFSASSLAFCVVTIFYFKHSDKWVLISPCGFICISLMANDTECFYMCLSTLFFISMFVSLPSCGLLGFFVFYSILTYLLLYSFVAVVLCVTMYIYDLILWYQCYATLIEVWKPYFHLGDFTYPTFKYSILNTSVINYVSIITYDL